MILCPRRASYTLFELILVLAILVGLATVTYPFLDDLYADFRLAQAVDLVRARWAEARIQAMNTGLPYRFAVVPDRGHFRIAPDAPEFWSGKNSPPAPDPAAPSSIIEESLPKGIRFTFGNQSQPLEDDGQVPLEAVDMTAWSPLVTFLPDGSASEDVEIVFRAAGARPLLLKLRALTGTGTVRPLPLEEAWK